MPQNNDISNNIQPEIDADTETPDMVDAATSEQDTKSNKSDEKESETVNPYTKKPIYRDIKKASVDDPELEKTIIEASGNKSELTKYLAKVENIPETDIEDGLTKDESLSIGINYESSTMATRNNGKDSPINSDEFVNNITHGNKVIGVTPAKVKAKGRLSGSTAVAKFSNRLGIGKHTMVTLWHSGFTLMLAPPKEHEILNLQYNIAKAEYNLGYETNNFVYSNYGVVINKLLVEFILDHVVASSLKLPEGKSYLDFIKLTDLDTMAIAMATSINPSGYSMTITCKNSLNIENNRPVCSFTATANVIPENLLWVNRKILTPEAMSHISKTTAGSQSEDDVLAYQAILKANGHEEFDITDDNGDAITFTIATPTLREYIDSGTLWVNSVIANAEKLFADSDTIEIKENKINTMISASVLNKYNSYIKSIKLDDSFVDEEGSINAVLEVLTSDTNISTALLDKILEYIDKSYIALVAKYNFDCPECKKAGRKATQFDGDIDGFKEFMPINAVEHFFALSALMYTKIAGRKR